MTTAKSGLKFAVISTGLVTLVVLGIGYFQNLRIQDLRSNRSELIERATEREIPLVGGFDQHSPRAGRRAARPVQPTAAELHRLAADFIAFSIETDGQDFAQSPLEPAEFSRAADLIQTISALDAAGLNFLLNEILTSAELDSHLGIRIRLARWAISHLGASDPERTLKQLAETPGLLARLRENRSGGEPLLTDLGKRWAAGDPEAAIAWFQEHGDLEDKDCTSAVRSGILLGAKAADPSLALEFALEGNGDAAEVLKYFFADNGGPPENRDACLAALRRWRSSTTLIHADEAFAPAIECIAVGISGSSTSFEDVTGWIDSALLTSAESRFLANPHLSNRFRLNETGLWIEWLARTLPAESATPTIREHFSKWRRSDFQAADAWRAAAPSALAELMTDPPGD